MCSSLSTISITSGKSSDKRRIFAVQAARMAEAHRAAQHGGTGELELTRLQDDGFVQRLMAAPVILTYEYP
jgi:hypothetical protein